MTSGGGVVGAREVVAAAVLVWLLGAVVGWCVGWAARGEQNRSWHAGVARELERTRTELDQAHAELDAACSHWEAARAAPQAAAVVHVHLSPPLPPGPSWAAGQARVVDAAERAALPRRAPPGGGWCVTPGPGGSEPPSTRPPGRGPLVNHPTSAR